MLPIFYWNKIQETGNLSYLLKDGSKADRPLPGRVRGFVLGLRWRKLMDEYVARFGFSENFLEICRKEKEILLYKAKRIANNDRTVNAFIKVAEKDLEELKKDGTGGNFWELKAYLEKNGFRINPFETSVSEFYTSLKMLSKQFKKTASASE